MAFPPFRCLTAPPSRPAGKHVTRFSGRFAPLRIVFPCHRGIGRATKGKRLYGQARHLTSPDLHILCRMCTVDNKAPQSNPFTQRIAKNKVPPPGGRWWRQPPKGVHFQRPQGGCMVFAAKGGIYTGARKGAHLASAAILYNSRGREPSTRPGGVSRSRTEPWQPRAERPGGWLNLHACKGVSTFGNTGKRRTGPGPDPDRPKGACHPMAFFSPPI